MITLARGHYRRWAACIDAFFGGDKPVGKTREVVVPNDVDSSSPYC